MKTTVIAHAALLLGNIGVLIALASGQAAKFDLQTWWAIRIADRQEAGLPTAAGDLAPMLETLLKEQALLREELGGSNRKPTKSRLHSRNLRAGTAIARMPTAATHPASRSTWKPRRRKPDQSMPPSQHNSNGLR